MFSSHLFPSLLLNAELLELCYCSGCPRILSNFVTTKIGSCMDYLNFASICVSAYNIQFQAREPESTEII